MASTRSISKCDAVLVWYDASSLFFLGTSASCQSNASNEDTNGILEKYSPPLSVSSLSRGILLEQVILSPNK